MEILDLRATWYKNYSEDIKRNFHCYLSIFSKLLNKNIDQIINGISGNLEIYTIIDGMLIETGELDRC